MRKTNLFLTAVFGILLTISVSNAQTSPRTPPDPQYRTGELVEAADHRGAWYKSKITDYKDGKYHVHFFGWDDHWAEWVTPDKVRYSNDYEFGREIEVEKQGVWQKALLIDSRYGTEHLVAYTDSNEEDEWVKDERIREAGDGDYYGRGRKVEVLYGKKWLRAEILKRRAGEVYVHYEDTDDTWNAWVSEDKIRRIR